MLGTGLVASRIVETWVSGLLQHPCAVFAVRPPLHYLQYLDTVQTTTLPHTMLGLLVCLGVLACSHDTGSTMVARREEIEIATPGPFHVGLPAQMTIISRLVVWSPD